MHAGAGPLPSAFFACHLVLCLIVRTVYQKIIKSQMELPGPIDGAGGIRLMLVSIRSHSAYPKSIPKNRIRNLAHTSYTGSSGNN
jgi:hypothetical protein